MKSISGAVSLLISLLLLPVAVHCQTLTINGRVELRRAKSTGVPDNANVVVWLTPSDSSVATNPIPAGTEPKRPRLLQKDKSFEPHILVVPVGSSVDFPNRDPFFHNVFSLFEGKRFDLGLYESGSTRVVRFDRPGVSYIFCNIHPEMGAVLIALSSPYYAVSDVEGKITIPHVPPGRYALHVWHEQALPEELKPLTREIVVSEDAKFLGTISLTETAGPYHSHKNKYGQDYVPTGPPSPAYEQP